MNMINQGRNAIIQVSAFYHMINWRWDKLIILSEIYKLTEGIIKTTLINKTYQCKVIANRFLKRPLFTSHPKNKLPPCCSKSKQSPMKSRTIANFCCRRRNFRKKARFYQEGSKSSIGSWIPKKVEPLILRMSVMRITRSEGSVRSAMRRSGAGDWSATSATGYSVATALQETEAWRTGNWRDSVRSATSGTWRQWWTRSSSKSSLCIRRPCRPW